MMEKHEGNRQRNENPIQPPDPFHRRVFTARRFPNVNGSDGKGLAGAGVTAPAGVGEVGGVDR